MNRERLQRQKSTFEKKVDDVLSEIRALSEGQAAIMRFLSPPETKGLKPMSNAFNALKDEVRKQTTQLAGLRAILVAIDRTPNDAAYNELMAELKANTAEVDALMRENTPAVVEPPVEEVPPFDENAAP